MQLFELFKAILNWRGRIRLCIAIEHRGFLW